MKGRIKNIKKLLWTAFIAVHSPISIIYSLIIAVRSVHATDLHSKFNAAAVHSVHAMDLLSNHNAPIINSSVHATNNTTVHSAPATPIQTINKIYARNRI